MCGIFGVYNTENKNVSAAMRMLAARGSDSAGWFDGNKIMTGSLDLLLFSSTGMGHVLHAIVAVVPEPLQGKGVLVFNGEIYNWEFLAKEENYRARNDAELLLQLLDACILEQEEIFSVLERLDGVFAFAYEREGIIVLTRDLLGEKPLWFSHQDGFGFASEKKVLLSAGFQDIRELNPRFILVFNKEKNTISWWQRPFFSREESLIMDEEVHAHKVKELLRSAVKKRLPSQDSKVGILFSGGLDSSLIAKLCYEEGRKAVCYTAVVDNPRAQEAHDLVAAREVAARYGFSHTIIRVKEEDIPALAQEVAVLIEEPNAVKVSVGMPFLAATKLAQQDGCKVLFSGLGAEELFAGYQRHKKSSDVNDECFAGLLWLYERDLYRDDVLTIRQGVELRLPFLDKDLTTYALSIPAALKLKDNQEKYILRRAALLCGLTKEDAYRPKKAAQYGSRFDNALERLARSKGLSRSAYLKTVMPVKNRRLGVLCSGGKDSWYAAFVMKKLNHDLVCCLTMRSENEASYMFHTPAIELVRLQAQAARLPFGDQVTAGEKEMELADLRTLLLRTKEEFHIDGIVTGALFSQYQRSRIEHLCNELQLKVFAPLWHLEQESELRELLDAKFVITMSAIAGDGLSEKWLGKVITKEDVANLVLLQQKIGFNVAGEGGEYESLVLDCPLFHERLCVETEKLMENEITGRLVVKKAWLTKKSSNE
jgi:asparagine synthase (glutamine-hydrolysing)